MRRFVLLLLEFSAAAFITPTNRGQCSVQWGNNKCKTFSSSLLRSSTSVEAVSISSEEIKSRMEAQLEKLKSRDASSKPISKNDLKVIYEDEHIVVVDKPAGVLCVPGQDKSNPSLLQVVYESFGGCEGSNNMDKMVVHRLGMDTSGLVVFARTHAALRDLNTLFRTRKVTRQYEALVCGHVQSSTGVIDYPLMRDYLYPPYMRISTEEHQHVLDGLDPDIVGKKLLQSPKPSLTQYRVISTEQTTNGLPVTRLALTSISGRTHQLNVHLAAFGHPIVGDQVYGINGEAAPNGGLDIKDMKNMPDTDLQEQIAKDATTMCIHAKTLSFEHPVTNEKLSFESNPPF